LKKILLDDDPVKMVRGWPVRMNLWKRYVPKMVSGHPKKIPPAHKPIWV
jgi:hypothetical protein